MFGMPTEHEYADGLVHGPVRGRGAGLNPMNRYESVRLHVLGDHRDETAMQADDQARQVETQVFVDKTRTIINPVNSPDIGFKWSLNPYRGCEHGCAYCYARPDHERLGFSSGLDFETKIMAKLDAPRLLRRELTRPGWVAETICMSGVTDPYQPIESRLRITRGCLEVMSECFQPVGIVTKNRLILRDIDLIAPLARVGAARVAVSVTTLDNRLASAMEPRASSPGERLRAIRELSDAGIEVVVMVAPIIPGLNDREIPQILEAAAEAGAVSAGYVLLRLPHQVKALFLDWLARHYPQRASHVQSLIRESRDGALYDSTYGARHRGNGPVAKQIGDLFSVFRRRWGLERSLRPLSSDYFRRPALDGQMLLF